MKPQWEKSTYFLIYADGAVFGAPVSSLEEAQEQAFKLLQRHKRVHIESLPRSRRHYWRYETSSHSWVQVPLAAIFSGEL